MKENFYEYEKNMTTNGTIRYITKFLSSTDNFFLIKAFTRFFCSVKDERGKHILSYSLQLQSYMVAVKNILILTTQNNVYIYRIKYK